MNTRRKSKEIQVGDLRIGGNNPIRIQTMANTDTNDIEASVAQAKRCLQAGTELLRYTTQGTKEAENLGKIKDALRAEGINLPLVADIHFNANVAEVAAQLVEKVRINPGNFVTGKQGDYTDEEWDDELRRIREKLHTLLSLCKDKGTAIRIGVNHGSLSPRIMSRYGNTPLGLATSCMEFIELCEQEGFTNLILSVKASNTRVMIYAVRLLVQMMDAKGKNYPLHLGVTEAGSDDEGRIKSAIGIGTLLHDGIGDTIRVSLSEAPEAEIPVARKLVDYIESQRSHSSFLTPHSLLKTDYSRRKTTPINNIGGDNPVVVVADTQLHTSLKPDYTANEIETLKQSVAIIDTLEDLTPLLATDKPVIFKKTFAINDLETLQIQAGAFFGPLLIDGLIDGIWLSNQSDHITAEQVNDIAFELLQSSRCRISKTEYTSCPSCGRTKFDLPKVVRQVKEATQGFVGLKIAVMGCIVNGPGEMADADFGYIGAGMGKVSLYRGKECVMKNIPEEEAIDKLLELINSSKNNK
ncbi:MAG: (E)-4-hydroxy-3-methylbut-2-enyl-diphosphate synthase [Paludibacteraceae bacterium]|nr:(E)-4-hydroxy-3-methylbut-2-enyl-diphosphate synthase [Paludibacteraceae bacterium]